MGEKSCSHYSESEQHFTSVSLCKKCHQYETREIMDCSEPILKYMQFPGGFFGDIVIFGTSYMLVAVAYTNDTHFKGRFLGVDGLVYEYDGMKDLENFDGGCSLVQSVIPFCTVLKKNVR
jgi:hypothetical protein